MEHGLSVFCTVHHQSKGAATLCPETFPRGFPLYLLMGHPTAAGTERREHDLFQQGQYLKRLFLMPTGENPCCPSTHHRTHRSCHRMKAQINISTQQQLFTATFLPCVCGPQEEGEIVKDIVGMASGWEEKVQLLSAAQQYDLYFWSKTAWHTEFHFSFKKKSGKHAAMGPFSTSLHHTVVTSANLM